MDYSFMQKVKMFICRKFGHKFDKSKEWHYNGHQHNSCKRCKHVISWKE